MNRGDQGLRGLISTSSIYNSPAAGEGPEKFRPERYSNPDLRDAGAVLCIRSAHNCEDHLH